MNAATLPALKAADDPLSTLSNEELTACAKLRASSRTGRHSSMYVRAERSFYVWENIRIYV